MKVRDAIAAVEADGWYIDAVRGDHRQNKHPTKAGKVTIAGHPSDDLDPGTEASIFRQAGIKKPRPGTGGKGKKRKP
jgi:predicted RNA binding protein YcfA (HicA-like mRNA interferase family)